MLGENLEDIVKYLLPLFNKKKLFFCGRNFFYFILEVKCIQIFLKCFNCLNNLLRNIFPYSPYLNSGFLFLFGKSE